MAPTTADQKVALDPVHRTWLKKMGAALEVQIADPKGQTTGGGEDAALKAKCKQIKEVVAPKVKDAVTADPTKKEEIKQLLEAAAAQESKGLFGDAFKSLKTLAETVKVALGGINEKAKYEAALPGQELKVSTLKNHKHASAIAAEVTKVEGYLKAAKDFAAKNKHKEANDELAKIDNVYPDAILHAGNTTLTRDQLESFRISYYNLTENQGIGAIDAAKVKELGDKIEGLDAIITDRKWTEYNTVTADIRAKLSTYRDAGIQHGDYVGLRENALLMLKSLEAHPNKDEISAEIADIKTNLIEKAKTEYEANADPADAINRYTKARDILNRVPAKHKTAADKANTGGKKKYETDRDAAKLKLKALDTAEKQAIVAKEITAIKAKFDLAEKRASVKQYSEALKLIAEIVKDCDAAEKIAKQQLDYNNAAKAAGDAAKNIEKDPKAAVEAVEKLHTQLKAHPQAAAISTQLGEIQKKIAKAKKLVA